MRRIFFIIIIFAALINAQTFTSEPNVIYVGWAIEKEFTPDSAGIVNAMNKAAALQNSSHEIITVDIATGVYDLGMGQMIQKDSVFIRWNPGVTMSSDNPTGTVIDDSIAVISNWEGNPTLINTYNNSLNKNFKNAGSFINIFGSRPYKVYTALLSQSGTDAPTAVVLENTLGGTIVWVRDAAGNYNGTLNGAFPYNKIYVNPSMVDFPGAFPDGYYLQAYAPNYINIQTYLGGVGTDNLLSGTSIEVRVYP